MHSEFRRLPVERHERARHARRQDIQPVDQSFATPVVLAQVSTSSGPTSATHSSSASSVKPGPATTTPLTTSTIATPSASQEKASSVVSSASASSSVLQTSSASSQSPSSTSITPSTTTSSTSTHSTTELSSSSSSTSRSVVLITTTSSPTPSANANNASAASTSGQLSGGAVGGIVAVSVIVALALLIFIVRKTYLRRRQTRRVSWPNGDIFETKPLPPAPIEDFSEKPASLMNAPSSPFDGHGQQTFVRQHPQPPIQRLQSPFTGYAAPAPPDPSYNNPMPAYPGYPTLNPGNPEAVVSMARAAASANPYPTPVTPAPMLKTDADAFVNRAFVPSLPDELSVTGGERIRVLTLYDDGWALCTNGRGEQGMVPQECLDQRVAPDMGDWRNARRSSSLNPDGRVF